MVCVQQGALLRKQVLHIGWVLSLSGSFHASCHHLHLLGMLQLLLMMHTAKRLGVVLFQFPTNFLPCDASMMSIRHLRQCLDSRFRMVVEFRQRKWFHPECLNRTKSELARMGVAVASSDELAHELDPGRFERLYVTFACLSQGVCASY